MRLIQSIGAGLPTDSMLATIRQIFMSVIGDGVTPHDKQRTNRRFTKRPHRIGDI